MRKKYIFIITIATLIVCNFFAWDAIASLENESLKVTFFYIGQGDSAFIQTPQGHQVIIDGGPDSTVLEKLGEEIPVGDRTIDLIILSHPDSDHITGLLEVLKNYEVENILWTGIDCQTSLCDKWNELTKEEEANIFIAQAGEKIYAGDVSIDVLYPFESLEGENVENTNNTSIVLRLAYRLNSFLFIGDLYSEIETQLLDENLKVDVLKVAHHGSKSSTTELFVEKVNPEIAIISCGIDNMYNHPHQQTLETLIKYAINVLRTDLNGDIKIFSNGEKITTNN